MDDWFQVLGIMRLNYRILKQINVLLHYLKKFFIYRLVELKNAFLAVGSNNIPL